jgi:hypothetical protein
MKSKRGRYASDVCHKRAAANQICSTIKGDGDLARRDPNALQLGCRNLDASVIE